MKLNCFRGAPNIFRRGFEPGDISLENDYGRRLNVYDWKEQVLIDTIHLGNDGKFTKIIIWYFKYNMQRTLKGITPLEIRFTHNPKRCEGFVGACLYSNVFRFYKKNPEDEKFTCEKIIDIPSKKVR